MKGTDRLKFRPRALRLTLCTFSFFCLLFLSPPAIDADEFTHTSQHAARLFSYGMLIVDTRMGDVRIEGWDEPRVEGEAEKTVRAGSERKARPLFDLIRIELAGQAASSGRLGLVESATTLARAVTMVAAWSTMAAAARS